MTRRPRPPWAALPPALADVLEPELPALDEEIISALRRRDPRVRPPAAGLVRPRRAPRRRGRARGLRRARPRRVAPRPAIGRSTYRELGARGVAPGPLARRAAGRLPGRRARRLAAAVPTPPRGAAATRPSLRTLAEAIFAYIDELAAESVAGLRGGAVARRRRARGAPAAELAELLVRGGADAEALAQAAQRAHWPLPRTLSVLAARDGGQRPPRDARASAWACCAPAPSCSCCPTRSGPRARDARGGARRRRPRPRPGGAPAGRRAVGGARTRGARARAAGRVGRRRRPPRRPRARRGPPGRSQRLADRRLRRSTSSRRPSASASSRRCWRGCATAAAPRRSPPTLHVHPQTVRYRLAALRELLGDATLADPEARFELELALRARPSTPPPRTADRAHPRRIDDRRTD